MLPFMLLRITANSIKKEPRQALFSLHTQGGHMTLSFSVVRLALCLMFHRHRIVDTVLHKTI